MRSEDFNAGMARLLQQWPTAYSTERQKLIAQEVRLLSPETWHRLVDRLLGEYRQAPLLPEIRDVLARERERTAQEPKPIEIDWNALAHCEYCRDLGVYLCRKKDSTGNWAFRCHCERGESHANRSIPQYKQDHANQGFFWLDLRKFKRGALQTMPKEQGA